MRGGEYDNTNEYLRDLIWRDQHVEEGRCLRMLIADGLESGEGRPLTPEVVDQLRAQALGQAVRTMSDCNRWPRPIR